MSKEELMSFFGVEVEKDCLFRLPSCFRHNNTKWDYVIKSDPDHSANFAEKLRSTGSFKVKQLENSKLWIVKTIVH